MTVYYGNARVSPSHPEAAGKCDRCQFIYSLRDLRFQREWAGTEIITLNLRVCPTCYDEPSPAKRTIFIKPDPVPVQNPRPEDYSVADVPDDGYTGDLVDLIISPPPVGYQYLNGLDGVHLYGADGARFVGDEA